MRKLILLVLVVLMPQLVFSAENYNNVNELNIGLDINLNFKLYNLDKTKMNDLTADLFLKPEVNYRQTIKSFELEMNPEGEKNEKPGLIRYAWRYPKSEIVTANLKTEIVNKNILFKIDKKVKYPVVFDGNKEYLGESKYIDINEDIRNTARDLVDSDDLFLIAVKTAEWVRRNIKYNLSTINAETVFKSSEVLRNGEGVCDEITNLFISLMRSLGIPARFVTGVVYTNLGYKWLNHGWSEVYFPGYGWVPFDVTFGQYGWIDPSHVKLQHTAGSGEASVNYRWHSVGGEVKLDKIDLNAYYINEKKDDFKSPIKISARSVVQRVKFESYAPIIVEVENLEDSYLSAMLYLANAPGVYGVSEKIIVLKPKEKKNLVFIAEFKGNLKEDFIYSSEVKVKDQFDDSAIFLIQAAKDYEDYSLDKALEFLKAVDKREKKSEFSSLNFSCNGNKNSYLGNETGVIKCLITSNEGYKNVNFCLIDDCKLVNMNKSLDIDFSVDFKNNVNGLLITAENNEFFKKEYLDIKINKIPSVVISEFNVENLNYNEIKTTDIVLSSNTKINDLKIKVNGADFSNIKEFDGINVIKGNLSGRTVYSGNADIGIEFKDESGNKYNLNKEFDVNVSGVPWYLRVIGFFEELF